jgi:hypothetical protein
MQKKRRNKTQQKKRQDAAVKGKTKIFGGV